LRWLGVSARHGNADAMFSYGYMAMTAPIKTKDVTEGYCWIVRAAMLDHKAAQEKLSNVFSLGDKDDRAIIPVDLAQADLWLRLAAQSPYHDNSQMRARIEPNMTTAQLDAVKGQVAVWQPKKLEELKAVTIPLSGGGGRNCAPF
jgi:TPR repeat protein